VITQEDIDAFADEQVQAGYVYALSNEAWPGWIKIGKSRDAEVRLNNYQTGSPKRDYKLVHCVQCADYNESERKAHLLGAAKTKQPWNKPDNGEWFSLSEDEAKDILRESIT
jgi:hypothetical protein